MRKPLVYTVSVLALLMVLSLMFLIPSGAITEEARMEYENAAWEEEEEEAYAESAYLPKGGRLLAAAAVFSDILPAADVQPLACDLFTPGSTPIAENYTENGYRDETIIVEMEKQRMFDSDVFIAYVKIATPSQLRTAIAGKKITDSKTNLVTTISKNYNGIVAINGDFYSDKNRKAGYISRMGEVYRKKVSKTLDLLLIDEMGDLHILIRKDENPQQQEQVDAFLSEHELVNGFFFGPGLVIDGEKRDLSAGYQFDPKNDNPRAGIAQLGDLTYALVVVNGRTENSPGVTLSEFADIMLEIGARQAYNLDGGNSATLAFGGKMYNDKPQNERSVSDIIYFASAIGD